MRLYIYIIFYKYRYIVNKRVYVLVIVGFFECTVEIHTVQTPMIPAT